MTQAGPRVRALTDGDRDRANPFVARFPKSDDPVTAATDRNLGFRARLPVLRRVPYPWLALGTAALAGSLTPLEANLVIVSLPSMARAFDVPASDVIWAMVTATLTTVGLALPIAVLSERWGRRNLFRYGFRVFAVGALPAMFAPGLP